MVRLAATADQQGPPPSMRQTAARGHDQGRLLRLVRHEGDLVSRSVRDPDYRQPEPAPSPYEDEEGRALVQAIHDRKNQK